MTHPASANVAKTITAIPAEGQEAHDRARAIALIQGAADGWQSEVERILAGMRPTTTPSVQWITTASLFEPQPPTAWIVEGLQLTGGRPNMWAGYGSSAKTLSAMTANIQIAAGLPVFGEFRAPLGKRVGHVDMDGMGKRASLKRIQRLCIGHGVDPRALGDRLRVSIMPPLHLSASDAVSAWCREAEQFDFMTIDALRGATPGIDENDSKIRECVDVLAHVSEKVGTAFLLLHHAGKAKEGHSDKRTVPRGSSAIFDACGSVFVLSAAKGEPVLVDHEKASPESEGRAVESFYFAIEDVAVGTNPCAGVRLRYMTAEQCAPSPASGFDALKVAILDVLRKEPQPSMNAICVRISGGNKSSKLEAIKELLAARKLVEIGGLIRVAS